jgi:hypothetical protein
MMSSAVETAVDIRPFHFELQREELDDLRRRVAATRWPEKETVTDRSQGVQLATIQALARYWGSEYDFGRLQARRHRPRRRDRLPERALPGSGSWTERAYPNLIYFSEVDEGKHFAAWQEPEIFTNELRAAFKSLR